ncbi:hypothetical protein IV500_05950 [Paeniglutamicibacter antarcticus]|uniref:Uncharacterized protein n=1 Tax=Arthrobacter terrae TaxID=2935737 RepID=A0A931CMM7_9MICC|nr:hypothetical protein [Arthrobacter terrae]MBG0738965.1 hypothetical protein [Arthrobacter terrae]
MVTTECSPIEAYEQMVQALRNLIAAGAVVDTVPTAFLADLDQIITETEVAVKAGVLPFAVANRPPKEHTQGLARWLWNRGFGSKQLAGYDSDHRTRLIVGAGLVDAPGLWGAAVSLISKVEAKVSANPGLPAAARHNLDERDQWLTSSDRQSQAADPFKNNTRADANRGAKAKVLARWLWDRSIDADTLLGFTPKYRREIARAAGVNPPSTLDTWEMALRMISKMEARALANPADSVTTRHHLDEHLQWIIDPHVEVAA